MISLTNNGYKEKKVINCLLIEKNGLPLHPLESKRENMNIATLYNLSVLDIVRVVVVPSRGEKGCMC